MSFLKNYVNRERVEALSETAKESLQKVEDILNEQLTKVTAPDSTPENVFDTCLKQHNEQISSLVERVAERIGELDLKGWKDYLGLFRFVWTIGIEVYQVVESMVNCAVNSELPPGEKDAAKTKFGVELVYFVWLAVDPLKNRFNYIPFKKTIEAKLVRWCARKALENAFELFSAGNVQTMSDQNFLRTI